MMNRPEKSDEEHSFNYKYENFINSMLLSSCASPIIIHGQSCKHTEDSKLIEIRKNTYTQRYIDFYSNKHEYNPDKVDLCDEIFDLDDDVFLTKDYLVTPINKKEMHEFPKKECFGDRDVCGQISKNFLDYSTFLLEHSNEDMYGEHMYLRSKYNTITVKNTDQFPVSPEGSWFYGLMTYELDSECSEGGNENREIPKKKSKKN